jgi:ABC-type transport system substrate-binding protein
MKGICLALLVFTLSSCTKKIDKNANVLNYALTSKISTIDPAISYDSVSAKVVNQIYETLYEYDYLIRPYQLKPLLATDLPFVEEDGLKYTIKLKKNIFYHPHVAFNNNKRAVIAQDFINQFKRLAFKPTKSNGWWLFDGKIKGLNKFRDLAKSDMTNFFDLKVSGLQAIDDHTLVIRLIKPYPQLKYALAMAFTTPLSKEVISFQKNNFTSLTSGTGPYIFKNWTKSSSLHLKKNINYHESYYPSKGDRISYEQKLLNDNGKKLPFIDEIHFHIMEQAQTRWLNFLQQKIDLIVLTKDHFSLALDTNGKINKEFKDKKIKLQIAPTLTYWWLAFNMKDQLLGNNLNLRKAIAHSVNIDEYINSFTNNIALKANSIYPPGIRGYKPSNTLPYEYDLKLAAEYLIKAGYPKGRGLPEFTYDVRGSSTVSRQMGEYIQKELAKVGINVKLILNSFPGFLQKARTGQLQIWQGGWSMDYPDPENVVQLLISKNHSPGPNSTYFSNSKVDELYTHLSMAKDTEALNAITSQIEIIVQKELPWAMQFYSRNYILFHKRVKNFRQSDLINNNFKYLRLE